jgi:DNA polymerase-3 subunit beta
LTGTDLDVGIVSSIPTKPAIKGAITVPAKKFFDILKELPPENISLAVKKNNVVWIECGKIVFKIVGLPKEEFPQVPEPKTKNFIPIQQKTLKKMLTLVSFAMSNDETRYVLNGILFIIKPSSIKLVATDGRRLAVAESEIELPGARETKAIVPAKAVHELKGLLGEEGDAKICFGENQVVFDLGQTRIISRLIEGEFPNYEQVIPKEAREKAAIPRDAFLAAMRRANLLSSQESLAVKMEFAKDNLVLSKATPYLGEVKEELGVEYKGRDVAMGFNPDYLIDVLRALEADSVYFELTDPEKPGVIRAGKEYTYVVLPMQLT